MSSIENINLSVVSDSELSLLVSGRLPKHWRKVASSKNAFVAVRSLEPKIYFKIFYHRNAFDRVKELVRKSRCQRAVDGGEILIRNGFMSPKILDSGRRNGLHYMITEAIPSCGLADYIYGNWRRPLAKEQLQNKRAMLKSLGELVGSLHKRGLIHGDLRPNNILIRSGCPEVQFYFIDNERTRLYGNAPEKAIIKNLVQIGMLFPSVVSRTDRMRFFKAYEKQNRNRIENPAKLIRQVTTKIDHRLSGRQAF